VQLGESVTPVEIPKVEVQITPTEKQAVDLPVPKGYLIGEEGVYLQTKGDDGEAPERVVIFTQAVWVSRVMVGENGSGSEVELSWINANGQIRTGCFKQSLLAVDSQFAGWLLDQNISGYLQIKSVIPYIRAGISCVARALGEQIIYDRFGLNERGFLVGTDLLTDQGRETARVSGRIDSRRVGSMQPRGTAEGYAAATRLLDVPHWWMHRYTVLAAFASALLAISGNQGSVLSLAGESSGGKTTSANLGVAAFGDYNAFTVDPKSTLNAFYEHWRQVNNLPLIVNEAAPRSAVTFFLRSSTPQRTAKHVTRLSVTARSRSQAGGP
jgi:hypothetical protein